MTSMENILKLLSINNQLLENDLDRIEREFAIDLSRGHQRSILKDEDYYPQIDRAIRSEASKMAKHYEIIYSLEKSIRGLIVEALEDADGAGWWNSVRVPTRIMTDSEDRMQREIDSGTTVRSQDPIDFTTFGELGEIIKSNWDVFGGIFSSKKAVEKVMTRLNTLRGPIAHCSPLAEDEVLRLQLSVRDWFRLME